MLEFRDRYAVRPGIDVYVPRRADAAAIASARSGRPVHIMGSRMAGKTSLAAGMEATLRDDGATVLRVDLGPLVVEDTTAGELVESITLQAATRLGLDIVTPDDGPPAQALHRLMQGVAQARPEGRIHLVLDEMDAVRRGPDRLGGDLLAALASLVQDPLDEALARTQLTLLSVVPLALLASGADVTDLVGPDDVHWIDNFRTDDTAVDALTQGFPPDRQDEARTLADRALTFSGGFPQACTWMCREVLRAGWAATPELLDRMRAHVDRVRAGAAVPLFLEQPDSYLSGYARSAVSAADPQPRRTVADALWTYRDLVRGDHVPRRDLERSHSLLLWSGLARITDDGNLALRSELVARHLNRSWATRKRVAFETSAVSTTRVSRELPRLCVLNTGGTIGMVDRGGQVGPGARSPELLAGHPGLRDVAHIDFVDVLDPPLDSANVSPPHWRRIAEAVGDRQREGYVGFVVAHGTDTMCHSASAVAFALGRDLGFPVVFTGAQTTAEVTHGDARLNLVRACKVASAGPALPEVAIAFGDKVFRACRAQKTDDRSFDAFASPTYPPLAHITEAIELDHRAIRPARNAPDVDTRAEFDDGFLYIAQVPGLRPRLYDTVLDQADELGLHGVLIETLGAGNIPTLDEYSLEGFIDRATTLDIPVVMGSPYPIFLGNPGRYGPSSAALNAGAIPVFNMTMPALVAKFCWVLGQHRAGRGRGLDRTTFVRQQMLYDLVGEIDEVPNQRPKTPAPDPL